MEMSWLISCAIVLHNLEEAIWLPAWSNEPKHWKKPLIAFEFRFATYTLSLVAIGLSIAITFGIYPKICIPILAGYSVAMIVNAIVPHLFLTLKTQSYMPGTATGLLMVLPTGVGFLGMLVGTHQMDISTILVWGMGIGLGLLTSLPALFWVARAFQESFLLKNTR
ncbi:MAG: HXXEE domain-containing protein [Planktotalea sp.]|uniref:HXXEE domain-containing protein n=1 Tax=Planktotalea sp. TaxID=2029877 RepID=UPI003C74FC13